MAGTIEVRAATLWSAASWLFDWVLNDLSTTVNDKATIETIREVVRENLGWLGIKDLPEKGRTEVLKVLCQSLPDHADRKLPADLLNRDGVLSHLRELSELACKSSEPRSP